MTTAACRLVFVSVALGAAIATTACSSSNSSNVASTSTDSQAATSSVASGCYAPTGGAARDVGLPTGNSTSPYSATLHTNVGPVTFTAYADKAPCTTNSFRYLAQKGFFNNTSCHRLTTSQIFVLQCGDPTGTGEGGPGYQFPDENLADATYPAGTVAMANSGPNTNGSQFFLVYQDTPLPPKYTPFGRVTAGLKVLTSVAAKGSDNSNGDGDGHPNQPVNISSVTIG
jgi:peptidyl-prolyl cis-trans isomerase B (cyclophilin B)